MSLLRMMIYTDDRSNMTFYNGESHAPVFSDILDTEFKDLIRFNGFTEKDGIGYLDVTVCVDDYCLKNKHVKKNSEGFRMTVCKKLSPIPNFGFSIHTVYCKCCGASFDATRVRKCPYCDTEYDMCQDDWVVNSIERVKG